MKKLVISCIAIAGLSLAVCAQKIDASKVPAAVKASFVKKYPGATARWEKEGGKFEAGFKQQGHSMSALFEANGELTESEIVIRASELPPAVTNYIKTHYKGSVVKETAKITKANGEVNFEAEIKGKDVLFDVNGNFIKEVKE
jgi:hypothetical protein